MSNIRYRINEATSANKSYKRNDIYRQFTDAFNTVFSAHPLSIDHSNGAAGYVPNKEIEERLSHFISSAHSHMNHFIGETGIGKSTYIRKVFGASTNPHIEGKTLFIPYYLNGKDITFDNFKSQFKDKLQAAYSLCRNTFSEIEDIDPGDICAFIKNHNAALLEPDDFFSDKSDKELLEELIKKNAYAFYAEMLKYACEKTALDQVVIVYDDIEGIVNPQVLFEYVAQACRFQTCFVNATDRSYSVCSIISMRPSTIRLLEETNWYHAFTPNDTLPIESPVGLAAIFEARLNYLVGKDIGSKYKEPERILEALEVLNGLMNRFEPRTLLLISELSNYNVRIALRLLASIISNRRFVQGDAEQKPQFVVKPIDYQINGGTIFRSLALEESDVYFDHRNNIFNILKNAENKKTDLIVAYICKYFYFKNSTIWSNLEKVAENVLCADLALLCEDKAYLSYSINYLVSEGAIEQVEISDQGKKTVFYIAKPRLFGIFYMLQSNSVLLDALRDDIYAPLDSLCIDGESKPIIRIRSNADKMSATLQFWEYIYKSEKSMLSRTHPSLQISIKRLFGDVTISKMVGQGIQKTLNATSSSRTSKNNKKFEDLDKRVSKFSKTHAK